MEGETFTEVTVFVRSDVLDKLKKAADRDSRPLNHIFNVALTQYVTQRKGR